MSPPKSIPGVTESSFEIVFKLKAIRICCTIYLYGCTWMKEMRGIYIGMSMILICVSSVCISGGNTSRQAVIPVSQEYVGKREVLDWYTLLGQISTKTNDVRPASVIVEVVLGYGQGDRVASSEITACQSEIKEYLRSYFSELSVEDLRPRNEEKRRTEIKRAINRKILNDSEIRDVRFLSLQIIEQ